MNEREKRYNAGNRMAQLMETEEEDDFYKELYGGFYDVENDGEWSEEESSEATTDSDISGDEKDEPISDHEDEGDKKRIRRVITKAYKEPVRTVKVKTEIKKECSSPSISGLKGATIFAIEKKSMRQSTAQKSALTKMRSKEMERLKHQKDNQKKKLVDRYILTQEELLEEAKVTEQENLKSLERYQQLELEKKKHRFTKPKYTGPMIRYHSVTMPLIEDVSEVSSSSDIKPIGKCTRNFITFTDEATFREHFPQKHVKPAPRSMCPVSKTAPRYFDPLTKTPFSSVQSFRILREAYYSQIEKKVDGRLPGVAKWLEWRKQNKLARQIKLVKPPQS